MKPILHAFALLFVTLAAMASPSAARSESLTFYIKSDYQYIVELEFYSQNRNHVWPGNNRVYILDDYDTKNITLSCNYGEKICYGAWVQNETSRYWGVGYDGRQTCANCCYTCDGGYTETITLY